MPKIKPLQGEMYFDSGFDFCKYSDGTLYVRVWTPGGWEWQQIGETLLGLEEDQ